MTVTDSGTVEYSLRSIPLIDSFKTDSLRAILAGRFQIHPPTVKQGRTVDPFDPFLRENYIRKGLGKFWFFLVTLVVFGLLMYFRNAFPNQLVLRVRSLFSPYHFRELISDFGLSFTSASVVAGLISSMIMAQSIVVVVVYSGYVMLNSVIFYILVLLGLVLWRVLLFFLQSLQAYILNISPLARSHTQWQINLDLGFALIMFPLITLAYYNSSRLAGLDVGLIVAIAIAVWIGMRILLEFLGLLRDGGFSLSGMLYFCAFEILPHAVLLTALFRRYSS